MPSKVMDDRPKSKRAATKAVATRRAPPRRPVSPARTPPELLHVMAGEDDGVRRLYTVAMMAEVLGAPPAAVRHWVRSGLLAAARRSGSIEWFDFPQLVVGKTLARLLSGGLTLRDIDAKLAGLSAGGAPEAAQHPERIVSDGRRLSIRRGDHLLGAGGQMQFGFYVHGLEDEGVEAPPTASVCVTAAAALPSIEVAFDATAPEEPTCVADLVDLAADLEAAGEFAEAAEALRAALQAGGPNAQIIFMLAELLYRMDDLTAARERYYAAVELDADHLEARTSLGCVLAELGDHELAIAALEGVLQQQPDYADAHWHMAGVLFDTGRPAEARRRLRTFLTLAPESPWATLAREKLQ